MDFLSETKNLKERFEEDLKAVSLNLSGHPTMNKAMSYSLLAGGKRLRPLFLLKTNEILGGTYEQALPLAVSIECIHTYSLIHDDLPAMDNDTLRRGMPTSHVVFGEANAILAGDALLNFAFENVLESENLTMKSVEALRILAKASGYTGMIAGQAEDLKPVESVSESEIKYVQENKTGKLITAPFLMASALNGKAYFEEFEKFGNALGLLFQITDDLLDVLGDQKTVGKTLQKDENKKTFINALGLEKAKEIAKNTYNLAASAAKKLPNSDFFLSVCDSIYNRNK